MVKTVCSIQYSVFRRDVARATSWFGSFGLKQTLFILSFLNIEHWTLHTVLAKNLGVHGVLHPLDEEDPIALIQQKLKKMEEKGELKKHNLHIQKRTKESVERPSPVEGISKATKSRRFTYDPTFTVAKDIKDHKGRVIHAKGTKINPLETVSMTENLIFIDGDDRQQKEWVLKKHKKGKVRLILVKGAPLALSEELGIPVYFDQGGLITKQLGIKHVPATVSQSNFSGEKTEKSLCLYIEEIALGDHP